VRPLLLCAVSSAKNDQRVKILIIVLFLAVDYCAHATKFFTAECWTQAISSPRRQRLRTRARVSTDAQTTGTRRLPCPHTLARPNQLSMATSLQGSSAAQQQVYGRSAAQRGRSAVRPTDRIVIA